MPEQEVSLSYIRFPKVLAASVVDLVYPPRCPACNTETAETGNLCGSCRADTPFIFGLACDHCGLPLPGDEDGPELCDDCLSIARPWRKGTAALCYAGKARSLILSFKHGDRTELAPLFASWMAAPVGRLAIKNPLLVPVPVHRWRLLRRRYNQAALLANTLGRHLNLEVQPDALIRKSHTPVLDGKTREERFRLLQNAICANPRQTDRIGGRNIILIDDVMTTGATLAAATDALHAAGADQVYVAVIARVAKDT